MERSGNAMESRKGPTLRLGSKGEAVLRLQKRLQELGYDPGPADGSYGWLTFAAVRDFQRAYRLDVDGVVGRRTRTTLFDESLIANRPWMVVAEVLPQSGRAMALRSLVRQAAGLSAIAAPVSIQSPVGPDTLEPAWPQAGQQAGRQVERQSGRQAEPADTIAAHVQSGVVVADDVIAQFRAAFGNPVPAWTSLHNRALDIPGQYPRGSLQTLLHAPGSAARLDAIIDAAAASAECDVIHLDLGRLRWGDGARFLRLVKRAAGLAAAAHKRLAVSLPLLNLDAAWTRLTNDLDYGAVGALASHVVLVPPVRIAGTDPPRPPSARELSAWVRTVVRRVPPWRCLLAVPLGSVAFPAEPDRRALALNRLQRRAPSPSTLPARPAPEQSAARAVRSPAPSRLLSYQRAVALAYGAGTRPQWDEAVGRPMFRASFRVHEEVPRDGVVWLETFASFALKVDIVRRYRLAGVYLTSVGAEDVRIWRVLRDMFHSSAEYG